MNELIDQLLVKILFTLLICVVLIIYKYIHSLLYPSSRTSLFKGFYSSSNAADSLHLFGRIIGLGIAISGIVFEVEDGIWPTILNFVIITFSSMTIYLFSTYILENIILTKFPYVDEVLKRRNVCYSLISFTISLSSAFLVRVVVLTASGSLLKLIILWPLALVFIGITSTLHKYLSSLKFDTMMEEKNITLALSYSGYLMGCIFIMTSALATDFFDIQSYLMAVILKLLLSAIIFPIFRKGIIMAFSLKDAPHAENNQIHTMDWGRGLFEGALFFLAALLTTIVIGQSQSGAMYFLF